MSLLGREAQNLYKVQLEQQLMLLGWQYLLSISKEFSHNYVDAYCGWIFSELFYYFTGFVFDVMDHVFL